MFNNIPFPCGGIGHMDVIGIGHTDVIGDIPIGAAVCLGVMAPPVFGHMETTRLRRPRLTHIPA